MHTNSERLGVPPNALIAFNHVSVNTGITKLVVGCGGTTLISSNEHAHVAEVDASLMRLPLKSKTDPVLSHIRPTGLAPCLPRSQTAPVSDTDAGDGQNANPAHTRERSHLGVRTF